MLTDRYDLSFGDSRTPLDVAEFKLLKACLNIDRLDDVRGLVSVRHPGPSGVPVGGRGLFALAESRHPRRRSWPVRLPATRRIAASPPRTSTDSLPPSCTSVEVDPQNWTGSLRGNLSMERRTGGRQDVSNTRKRNKAELKPNERADGNGIAP
jgi:hypothetical protein